MAPDENNSMTEKQRKYLPIAERASEKAGNHLRELMNSRIQVVEELPHDVKLEADLESESIILDILNQESDFPVLTEERGLVNVTKSINDTGYQWIVDPLDGSLNFLRGIPMCCVSIALWQGAIPILGVIYDFNRNEMFKGLVGEGAWLNGVPILASKVKEVPKAVLATGFPVSSDFSESALLGFVKDVQDYKKIRLFGSAALSLAYVACGRVDVYREKNIKIWDVAGGLALVKASAGFIECQGFPEFEIVAALAGTASLSEKTIQ